MLALSNVTPILEILFPGDENIAKRQEILDEQDRLKKDGVFKMVGVIVREKYPEISEGELNIALAKQASLKAEAALSDIKELTSKQSHPAWLKANWNYEVDMPTTDEAKKAKGASAVANYAQNIVMIANSKPEIAPEFRVAVEACRDLALGIANGINPKDVDTLVKFAEIGLRRAAAHTDILEEQLNKYIDFSQDKIVAAIGLAKTQDRTK